MSSASNGNGAPDAVPEGTRIGAQLKAARLAARMSMAEVAEQAGLTKGFVSKLERDLVNVSVASLIRLCDALGVSVGSLFQAPTGEVIRHGAYPPINFGGKKMTEYLLTPSGEKRVQAILSDIEPGGGSGDDPYALPADVEFAFVLAGQLQVTVAGEQVTLDQGDAFTFPAGTQHTFRATPQAGRTQVLWVVSPALPDAPLYAQPPASQHAGERAEPGHQHEPAQDGQPAADQRGPAVSKPARRAPLLLPSSPPGLPARPSGAPFPVTPARGGRAAAGRAGEFGDVRDGGAADAEQPGDGGDGIVRPGQQVAGVLAGCDTSALVIMNVRWPAPLYGHDHLLYAS